MKISRIWPKGNFATGKFFMQIIFACRKNSRYSRNPRKFPAHDYFLLYSKWFRNFERELALNACSKCTLWIKFIQLTKRFLVLGACIGKCMFNDLLNKNAEQELCNSTPGARNFLVDSMIFLQSVHESCNSNKIQWFHSLCGFKEEV